MRQIVTVMAAPMARRLTLFPQGAVFADEQPFHRIMYVAYDPICGRAQHSTFNYMHMMDGRLKMTLEHQLSNIFPYSLSLSPTEILEELL